MQFLNVDQVNSIAESINANEITYSHLQDDLLDHVCTDVEILMEEGLNFEEATNKILKEIGNKGLKEIQEATIFYVKLNLLIMKKTINLLAIISMAFIIGGLLFKMFHLPGGSILFFFGMLLAFLAFLPATLVAIKKEKKINALSLEFIKYIIGFIALFTTGAAMLFTTMHWPGGSLITLVSWIFMLVGFFPILFYSSINSEKNRALYLSLTIFAFLFFGWIVVSGYNYNTNRFQAINYLSINEELCYYENQNTLLEVQQNEQLISLNAQKDVVDKLISKYQELYINDKKDIFEVIKSYRHKSAISLEDEERLNLLKTSVQEYCDMCLAFCNCNEALEQFIMQKLDTESRNLFYAGKMDWKQRLFYADKAKISYYTTLLTLQKDINQVYYEIANHLPVEKAPEL